MRPPSFLIHAPRAQKQTASDRGKMFQNKNQGYWCIKQGLDGNWTKVGKLKVANIENNTVAFSHLTWGKASIFKLYFDIIKNGAAL